MTLFSKKPCNDYKAHKSNNVSDIEYSGRVQFEDKPPEGMSWLEWKRLKQQRDTDQYLMRNESVHVSIPDNKELNMLFRRGELLRASELEAKKKAEQQVREQFESAVEEQSRLQRHQKPKLIPDIPATYTREPFVD